jgi:hypothetical protein
MIQSRFKNGAVWRAAYANISYGTVRGLGRLAQVFQNRRS